MNEDFDLDKIGKKMPYTTPDGFFDELESNIWKEVKGEMKPEKIENPVKRRSVYTFLGRAAAVAAVVVVVLMAGLKFSKPAVPTVEDVDLAFCQLSDEDQDYLLSIYQEDIFINE